MKVYDKECCLEIREPILSGRTTDVMTRIESNFPSLADAWDRLQEINRSTLPEGSSVSMVIRPVKS